MKLRALHRDGKYRLQRRWFFLWRDCYLSGRFYRSEQRVHEGHHTTDSLEELKEHIDKIVIKKSAKKKRWQVIT